MTLVFGAHFGTEKSFKYLAFECLNVLNDRYQLFLGMLCCTKLFKGHCLENLDIGELGCLPLNGTCIPLSTFPDTSPALKNLKLATNARLRTDP